MDISVGQLSYKLNTIDLIRNFNSVTFTLFSRALDTEQLL